MFRIIEGTLESYDFETNLKQQFTRGPDDRITQSPRGDMVCAGDSRLLAVPDADGVIRLWSVED